MSGEDDIVFRLRKRAEIRRQIPTRKSVQEGKPDRISDLLEESANTIEHLRKLHLNDNRKSRARCRKCYYVKYHAEHP